MINKPNMPGIGERERRFMRVVTPPREDYVRARDQAFDCEKPGCFAKTTRQKPFCYLHLADNPYVGAMLARHAAEAASEARETQVKLSPQDVSKQYERDRKAARRRRDMARVEAARARRRGKAG